MSGEKGTLMARVRLHVLTRGLTTDLGDGVTDPFALSLPLLRKARSSTRPLDKCRVVDIYSFFEY